MTEGTPQLDELPAATDLEPEAATAQSGPEQVDDKDAQIAALKDDLLAAAEQIDELEAACKTKDQAYADLYNKLELARADLAKAKAAVKESTALHGHIDNLKPVV